MSKPVIGSSQSPRGYGIALVCTMFLSTTAIFIRHLTLGYHLAPLVLAFWRDLFTVITVAAGLALVRPAWLKAGRRHLVFMALYGLILAAFNASWTFSVALNGAAVATVLVYCSAAFTAILGWWILHERLGWGKVLAVLFSLAGCVLVAGASDPAVWKANFVGVFTGVLAGLCYAAYSLMGRAASGRGISPWTTLLYTFGFATAFLFAINLIGGIFPGVPAGPSGLFALGESVAGWGVLFLLAAGPTVLGFGLYNVSLVHLPASIVNLIATLEPAFTAVIAFFLLGEKLTGRQIGGSLLIMAGVAVLRIYEGMTGGRESERLRSPMNANASASQADDSN